MRLKHGDYFYNNLTKLYNLVMEGETPLVFEGPLLLGRTDVTRLPDNLTVTGDLSLYFSGVQKLPKGLKVEGNLNLSMSKIKVLPEDIEVEGTVFWEGKYYEDIDELREEMSRRMPQ